MLTLFHLDIASDPVKLDIGMWWPHTPRTLIHFETGQRKCPLGCIYVQNAKTIKKNNFHRMCNFYSFFAILYVNHKLFVHM